MSLSTLIQDILAFVSLHEAWAPLIVCLLAFGESFAIVSLAIPATVILVGVGALIGVTDIKFWPVWAGAAIGASLGDWISYWIGYKLENTAKNMWPLSRYPEWYDRGEQFFHKYGVWSIFLGRFFGPFRAVVPLVAGVFEMPQLRFQIANVTSAMLWAFVLLAPGFTALKYLW